MGAILTNETDKIAYGTLVTFDALDSAGRTVIHHDHQLFRTQAVPVILPGDSLAVGLSNAIEDATRTDRKQIASVVVNVQVSKWLAEGDSWNGLGRMSATVVPGSSVREPNGTGSLQFDVESTNCEMAHYNLRTSMISRGASAVFRDVTGAVIGGSLDNQPQPDTCRTGKHVGHRFSVNQTDIPANADLDRTSVTVYCDFGRPVGRVTSGAPYN